MAALRHSRSSRPKPVNLALQGGGAHGAFSWGALDRILEDERLEIVAVSGASAGAMNAAVLAEGVAKGCRQEARATLRRFWEGVASAALASPFQRSPIEQWLGGWSLDSSPGYLWFDLLSRLASPYDVNPLDLNPLRDVVAALVNFDAVRACDSLKIFVSATNVETGLAEVFDQSELTVDHIMASACLPLLYKAVDINGAPYWDGGYMGNPPLWPLFEHSAADDVIVIQINPLKRKGAPRSAREILNRLNEITFNASLLREFRAIDFVARLLEAGRLEDTGYRRVLVHMIEDEAFMSELGASSKLNAERAFLETLFERGRLAADGWLAAHFDALGARSTINLRAMFQGADDALDGARLARKAAYQSAAEEETP